MFTIDYTVWTTDSTHQVGTSFSRISRLSGSMGFARFYVSTPGRSMEKSTVGLPPFRVVHLAPCK